MGAAKFKKLNITQLLQRRIQRKGRESFAVCCDLRLALLRTREKSHK
jgi:hypothetical protein